MLRRFLILSFLVAVFILIPHSASAQLLCGPEYGGQECVDNFNNQAYGYGGSGGGITQTSTSRDSFGCPGCHANMSKTWAICVHVQYASGFCNCGDPKPMPTEYSNPQCGVLNGSCRYR